MEARRPPTEALEATPSTRAPVAGSFTAIWAPIVCMWRMAPTQPSAARAMNSIESYAGENSLSGGAGNDSIYAEYGDNTISGGTGGDTIYAEYGSGLIYGNQGADSIITDAGAYTQYGGQGDDTISSHQEEVIRA